MRNMYSGQSGPWNETSSPAACKCVSETYELLYVTEVLQSQLAKLWVKVNDAGKGR